MNALKVSVSCVVLTASQLASAAGPYHFKPAQLHTTISTLHQGASALLAPTIKISPHFVSTYEPSINGWVATPRVRLYESSRTSDVQHLLEQLGKTGSVDVPASLVDPDWMQKYQGRAVIAEDPQLLKFSK